MWCQYTFFIAVAVLTTTRGSSINSALPLDTVDGVHFFGGVPWMLIPDSDGALHVAILTEISPPITRDVAEDVQLLLYTRLNNGSTPYRLRVNDTENLEASGFNPDHPTKILIHGFGGNGGNSIIIHSKNAYLAKGEYNVIGVDWSVLSPSPNYIAACRNAVPTGEHIAELVEFLVEQKGASHEDFHIIGHSLGAQVAGFAGNSTTTGKIGRITGLDAAYPMFGNAEPEGRLDSGDALLVDAIHTCSGSLGFREPYTHVDFYPNGGTRPQPGCVDDDTGECSHARSHEYFIQSIEVEDAFQAVECLNLEEAESKNCTGTSTAIMGDAIKFDKPGIYYVDTTT